MCCLKRSDRPANEKATLHFHECDGLSHNLRKETGMCTLGDGVIYTTIEIGMEAARSKVL